MTQEVRRGSVLSAGFGGSISGSFDVGTNPKALVLCAAEASAGSVTIGGETLTLYNSATFLGYRIYVYLKLNPGPMSGVQAVAATNTGAGTLYAFPFAVNVNGDISVHQTRFTGSAASAGTFTADTGDLNGTWVGVADTQFYAGMLGNGQLDSGDGRHIFGSENAFYSGSRAAGIGMASGAVGFLVFVGGDTVLEPTRFGSLVDFRAGLGISASGPAAISTNRIRGLKVGFRPGLRMGATMQRQVALVGPDAARYRFTPEMTVGGTEGHLLTQHADEPPTWEDVDNHVHSRRWVPAVFRPNPIADPDDWQILHADDGSVVMTWVED